MNLLIMTDLEYPCDHSFLEEVYVKRLKACGYSIFWIMREKNSKNFLGVSEAKWGDSTVFLIPSKGMKNLRNVLFSMISMILNISKLAGSIDYDIVQVRNDPVMGVIALISSRCRKRKFVYQYTFYKGKGHYGKRDFTSIAKYFIGSFIEKCLIRGSDLTFTISNTMKEELVGLGYNEDKLVPIPLGVDEFQNANLDNALQLSEKFDLGQNVIVYLGTMNSNRKLNLLIPIYSKIINVIPDAQIVFIGDAVDDKELQELKNSFYMNGFTKNQVVFTGRVERRFVYDYLECAHVCVSLIPPVPLFKIASPIKLMDYMNAGKPVVANKGIVEQDMLIENSKSGYLCDYEVDDISTKIIYLLNNPEFAIEMGQMGRKYIRKERSYTSLAKLIDSNYIRLIEGKV